MMSGLNLMKTQNINLNKIMTQYEWNQILIANTLNEFDFIRVHQVMVCLDWKWYYDGIPTIDELRTAARERIDSTIKGCIRESSANIPYHSSSGGLKVTVEKNIYGQIDFIRLEFVVSDWETISEEHM